MLNTEKHTPGPWTYAPYKRGILNLKNGETSEMKHAGFAVTAVEPKKYGGTRIFESDEQMIEANAALIARAPALLAQNKRLRETLIILLNDGLPLAAAHRAVINAALNEKE